MHCDCMCASPHHRSECLKCAAWITRDSHSISSSTPAHSKAPADSTHASPDSLKVRARHTHIQTHTHTHYFGMDASLPPLFPHPAIQQQQRPYYHQSFTLCLLPPPTLSLALSHSHSLWEREKRNLHQTNLLSLSLSLSLSLLFSPLSPTPRPNCGLMFKSGLSHYTQCMRERAKEKE